MKHYTDHLSHDNSRQLTHLNKALVAVCMRFSYFLFRELAVFHVIVHVDSEILLYQWTSITVDRCYGEEIKNVMTHTTEDAKMQFFQKNNSKLYQCLSWKVHTYMRAGGQCLDRERDYTVAHSTESVNSSNSSVLRQTCHWRQSTSRQVTSPPQSIGVWGKQRLREAVLERDIRWNTLFLRLFWHWSTQLSSFKAGGSLFKNTVSKKNSYMYFFFCLWEKSMHAVVETH